MLREMGVTWQCVCRCPGAFCVAVGTPTPRQHCQERSIQMGGKCVQCGTTDAQTLCICPETPIGHRTTPLSEVRRNLAAFHLLCANCRRKEQPEWQFVGDDDQYQETWRKGTLIVQVDRRTAGLPPLCQIPASKIPTTPLAGPPKTKGPEK